MTSTKDVLEHHLQCFGQGDLQGILSDYAEGAVLFTPNGPLTGADARNAFTNRCSQSSASLGPCSA